MHSIRYLLLLILCLCTILTNAQKKSQQTIKIGTFNIQNFGKSKIAKPVIIDTLATIVRMFDVIAVQEISDVSNTVALEFLKHINNNKYHYKLACSNRTGSQSDDKSSQEQYAFYYNSDVLTLIDTSLYDDSQNDYFQREPYIASFKTKSGNMSFIICTVHTSPEQAVSEIGALSNVATWLPNRFKNINNIIFCGDFNASCTYAKPEELANLAIHKKPYNWIIPDNEKTNLSAKTDCAYDRFVVTDGLFPKVTKWSVVRYFKTKSVSDHWPVCITIKY